MRKILLIADQVSDIDEKFAQKNNIIILPLSYTLNDVEYDDINKKHMPAKELYNAMRQGQVPKTSQVTPDFAKEVFVKYINKGYDILYIACSSGISGTINSAKLAKNEIEEDKENLIDKNNQDFKLGIVDSLSASLGYGMLVTKVNEELKDGKNFEELVKLTKKVIPTICHYFTVDDLNHLQRGGRVSKATAFIGGILKIKPVLHVDDEGRLIPIAKAMGRKKAIKMLVDFMESKIDKEKAREVFISHGDCEKELELLKQEITKRFNITKFTVGTIGPIVGSHAGPGTIALFFVGKNRKEANNKNN